MDEKPTTTVKLIASSTRIESSGKEELNFLPENGVRVSDLSRVCCLKEGPGKADTLTSLALDPAITQGKGLLLII